VKRQNNGFSLPALASLGELRNAEVVVVIDSREITPLPINRLPSVVGTLQTGDYSFRGGESLLAIERKTVSDLVSCCQRPNRDRFERELHTVIKQYITPCRRPSVNVYLVRYNKTLFKAVLDVRFRAIVCV
jgi:ERCC4-type nuclease